MTNDLNDIIARGSKTYAENFSLIYNPETFALGVQSGTEVKTYALSPAHAKRLVAHMSHVVKEYEDKFGPIVGAEWTPNIPSPIQFDQSKDKPKEQ